MANFVEFIIESTMKLSFMPDKRNN